jgi:hypothetical protein
MGSIRAGIIFAVIACFFVLSAPPSGAIRAEIRLDRDAGAGVRVQAGGVFHAGGVATLETQQSLVPPGKGTVQYRGGLMDNHVTAVQDSNGGWQITDPDVLIVAFRLGLDQNCTGGFGSASCEFGHYFSVLGEEGDDYIETQSHPVWPSGNVYVNCGPGNDEVVVTLGTSVDPSCEDVIYT